MFSGRDTLGEFDASASVLLQVFVRGWAAGGAAGGPALDVREDASKLHTNQNMFSHPGTRGPHAKDEIYPLFLKTF